MISLRWHISYLLTICCSFISSCIPLNGTGTNTLIYKRFSPSKAQQAVLFSKTTALSDDSFQVSILNDKDNLDNTTVGNVFTADANHNSTKLDSNAVSLTWLSENVLKITYDKKLRTFIKNDKSNKIKVVYVAF